MELGTGDPDTAPPIDGHISIAAYTPEAFLRCLTSTNRDDCLQAVHMIRGDPRRSSHPTISIAILRGFLLRCLMDSADSWIRHGGRDALGVLARHVRSARGANDELVNELFAPILRTLIATQQDLPSEWADEGNCLDALREVASALPEVIRPHIGALVSLCHQVVHSVQKDVHSRNAAMSLLSTVCQQAFDAIPEDRLPDIVATCLAVMVNFDDDDSQAGGSLLITLAFSGKAAFRTIVIALFEMNIVAVALPLIDELLQDSVCGLRLGALHALESIAITSGVAMMEEILSRAKPALHDELPPVREQACAVFRQMAQRLGQNLDLNRFQEVVPPLVAMMADIAFPQVANSAAEAILTFINSNCAEVVTAHIDLTNAIAINLDEVAKMRVLPYIRITLTLSLLDIVNVMASMASAQNGQKIRADTTLLMTPELFDTVYDRLIGSIKRILRARDVSFERLKEVYSHLVSSLNKMNKAISKEKACKDASDVLGACATLIGAMNGDEASYLLMSMKAYCNSLGDGCTQFLPLLMPLLTHKALYRDPDESREYTHSALFLIEEFAKNHGDAFAPYVEEVSAILLHNSYASSALPYILKIVKHRGMRAMRAMWLVHWTPLYERHKDARRLREWLDVIGECVVQLGPEGVTSTDVREIGDFMRQVLLCTRDYGSTVVYGDEGYLTPPLLSQLLIPLLQTTGANCLSTVHALMPLVFLKMGQSEEGIRCTMAYFEAAPDMAFIYHQPIIDLLIRSLSEWAAVQRREGAFALGTIALSRRPQWSPVVARSLPSLAAAITRPGAQFSDVRDDICATDNAISAAAKIIKCCNGAEVEQWIPSFVEWALLYGVQEDERETVHVYGVLADLIEKKHPLIIGENNVHWNKLVVIIVKALHENVFDETAPSIRVFARLITILQKMEVEDEGLFDQCVREARFEASEKETLDKVFSQ